MKRLSVIAVALVALVTFGQSAAASTSAKPIGKQNCKELGFES
jgi:hypothetical protein